MKVLAASVDETRALGAHMAARAKPGEVYALEGELGAGKTEFVRGFVQALNPAAVVKSPSFTIVNIYRAPRFPVFHFDFYRIASASELGELGLEEYLCGEGVSLIEWGTLFPEALPGTAMTITFRDLGATTREITVP